MDSNMIKALETCEKMHGREFDVVEQVIFRTAYAMGVQDHQSETTVEIAKLRDLIEEQKGTIKALNIALGGDDSTSTENLIDSHERDPDNKGLILVTQELADGMRDVFPAAHRLALELEGILLSCTDTCATAKWWDSANEALAQWRGLTESDQPHISPLGVD